MFGTLAELCSVSESLTGSVYVSHPFKIIKLLIATASYSEEDAPESPVTPSRASPSKRLLLPLEEEELEEEGEKEPHSPVYKDMDIERRQEEISLQIKVGDNEPLLAHTSSVKRTKCCRRSFAEKVLMVF